MGSEKVKSYMRPTSVSPHGRKAQWKQSFTAHDKRQILENFVMDDATLYLVYEKVFGGS